VPDHFGGGAERVIGMTDKKMYRTIGLMSGTSLDGVDAAILETDGETIFAFGEAVSLPYSDIERGVLESATQKAIDWNFKGPPLNEFVLAENVLHQTHTAAVQALIFKSKLAIGDFDLVGFHGQTVLHRPPKSGVRGQTLQLGDGQKLARTLGVDVAFDFRSADVAAGGQGAPLAPIYHKALLNMAGLEKDAVILNVGGVSNFTLMGADGELIASDSGPGNGPLDQWVKAAGLGDYDKDGALSFQGTPDFARVEGWLNLEFFSQSIPKSADRYDFDVLSRMHGLSVEDGAATLCAFTAMATAKTLGQVQSKVNEIIVCGGGRMNPAIMAALRETTGARVTTAETHGWNGDALEAQAFAYLAVRTAKRLPLSFPKTTGAKQKLTGGIIASPQSLGVVKP